MHRILLLAMFALFTSTQQTARSGEPVPVFDLHSDILLRVIDNDVDIGDPPHWPQTTIPTMREGYVWDQVFAVWVNPNRHPGFEATERALHMIDRFHDQQARYPKDIQLARTVREAEAAKDSGAIAVWLWIEGGAPINNDLAMLRMFHRLGVTGMTLTWTQNLDWAGSSTDRDDPEMGLTEFGREVVREMDRLGMVVDVSHVSDRTFFDALETTTNPVIASHSGCRALANHPRNLSDEQLRALADNGGVIGIVALPSYLSEDLSPAWREAEEKVAEEIEALREKYGSTSNPEYREARRVLIQSNIDPERAVTLDTYLDHIEHAIKVAGEDHVGFGADFDGMWAFPVGFEKASRFQDVINGLRARGHSEETIRKVAHENVYRVLREVIGE